MTMICVSIHVAESVGVRLRDALRAWCAIAMPIPTLAALSGEIIADGFVTAAQPLDVDEFVANMFRAEGVSLVRLARLFVDDRNAAEDLVQEAFIRLARSARRIEDPTRAPAYLRSIVLNLARDHNRRGLVSLRQQLPLSEHPAEPEHDTIVLQDEQQRVLDALRGLPVQQRNCVVLRHYEELGIAEIAQSLGISQNSVKTHLRRGMANLARTLALPEEAEL